MQTRPTIKKNCIPFVQDVQFIEKNNGLIKGYAVNTFHGRAKNYNEDRVSIIMNITKPSYKGKWPQCSYFAVFDGHGGNACSDFLKQEMHKFITQNEYFPSKPIQALKEGFKRAEQQFLKLAESRNPIERSGSCALVLLVIDNICYVANVGDCRIILSTQNGRHVYPVSKDHKPDSETEKSRIYEAGGKIYQSCIKNKNGEVIYGPHRIDPGKLSVSRSFGDIEAKLPKYGGNPRVLIAKPEITYFTINPDEHDFLMMGSDGIFDKMTNEDIIGQFWGLREEAVKQNAEKESSKLHFIGKSASKIITKAMQNMSMDNLTTLLIVFQDNGRLQQLPVTDLKKQMYSTRDKRVKSFTQQQEQEKAKYFSNESQLKQGKSQLRKQVSKVKLANPQLVRKPNQLQQQPNILNHEFKKDLPKDFSESIDSLIRRKRSLYKGQEQNMADLANRNDQNHHQVNLQQVAKSVSKKIETKMYSSEEQDPKKIQEAILKRKKSHGILRKQSHKKETLWSTISKGMLKREQKDANSKMVAQKIRY